MIRNFTLRIVCQSFLSLWSVLCSLFIENADMSKLCEHVQGTNSNKQISTAIEKSLKLFLASDWLKVSSEGKHSFMKYNVVFCIQIMEL